MEAKMISRKTITGVAVAAIVSILMTGCISTGSKVSSLTTKQVKQGFVKGKTTSAQIREQYGDPSEENIITLAEAKAMFKAKDQGEGGAFNTFNKLMQMSVKASSQVIHGKQDKEEKIDPDSKIEVEYWAYNDYEYKNKSFLNPLAGKKRVGAKLMLVFDNDSVLVDYKFQKFSSR
jgi:hypothetical protein